MGGKGTEKTQIGLGVKCYDWFTGVRYEPFAPSPPHEPPPPFGLMAGFELITEVLGPSLEIGDKG